MSLKAPKNRFKEGTKTLYWVRGKQWEDVDGNIYDIRQSKPTALNTVLAVSWQHQLCPKCFGEGQLPNLGASSSLYRICPVCDGAKTLIVPICPPACATAKGEERKE